MDAEGDIGVIIPCHDDGPTLGEAVASVRAQDVPVAITVVDDGSSDEATAAVLARLESDGVRVLRQPNLGPAAARMAGLGATRTRYVFPLDADDRLLPGALRALRAALERHPRAAAAWGSTRHFGSLEFVQRSVPSLDPWHVSYQNRLPLSALYRRDVLVAVGGWQLEGGYEDWDLWMTLAERGFEGVGVPELTGEYRVRPGRRLSDSSSRHAERCTRLRNRHPRLFEQRRANRRASRAPRTLKLTLPAIDVLPLPPTSKRLLAGAACYLAYGSGWPTVTARLRAHRIRRAR
jgi:glycosyltransferase involved in cell wall biosynthesis